MKYDSRASILAIIILSVIVMSLYYSATDDDVSVLNRAEDMSDQEFDYFMTDVDNTQFEADGRRRQRIQAQRLTHYSAPERTLLEAPRFVIYREDGEPWYIRARNGRIDTDPELEEERIELMNDVVITREDAAGRELNVYTEFLTVYPDSQRAHTDLDVLMVHDGSEVSSTGMRADMVSNHIELLANVRGYYE